MTSRELLDKYFEKVALHANLSEVAELEDELLKRLDCLDIIKKYTQDQGAGIVDDYIWIDFLVHADSGDRDIIKEVLEIK